mmetsp:Transcript_128020/g.410202  ORF Transcript_128020/g.410202 Transcript_128020/m.410202 type:complete len:227 (-) Transcript_128020:593-1273(-)
MAFGDGASGSTVGTVGAGSENPMAAGGTAGWCWCGGGDDGGEKHRQRSVEVLCSSLLGPRCNISARPSCWEEAQLGAAPCAGGSPRARKQVRSLPKPPTPTVEEERCVVWVSIDPRSGSISAYPSDCANRVEDTVRQARAAFLAFESAPGRSALRAATRCPRVAVACCARGRLALFRRGRGGPTHREALGAPRFREGPARRPWWLLRRRRLGRGGHQHEGAHADFG